jgi:hypothetical protein
MPSDAVHPYLWSPGVGPDPKALRRLERQFPKPSRPMGEAWFMGIHRRLFHELMEADPASVPVEELDQCLMEIATGTCSFGPAEEWDEWFHYLLPRLLPVAFEWCADYLVEYLVTAFFALHPRGIREQPGGNDRPLPEFQHDVLVTLGRAMMEPSLWEAGEPVVGRVLHPPGRYGEQSCWGWFDASGDFSALMFLNWKYLHPEQIDDWLQSVLRIESSHWRAQLLVWLLGAVPVLTGEITRPHQLERTNPRVSWGWSSYLTRCYGERRSELPIPLISEPNRAAFGESLRRHLTAPLFLDWIDSFARFDYLERELGWLPDQFIGAFFEDTPLSGG